MKAFNIQTKLFSCLKTYDKKTFMSDLMAGIIVGIVALPLAIAFGIASGVTPEKGIITAIVAGLVISLFGGSKVQIGGPTGAFIIIIYGIIQKYGFEGLTIATLMAGFFLVLSDCFDWVPSSSTYPIPSWWDSPAVSLSLSSPPRSKTSSD